MGWINTIHRWAGKLRLGLRDRYKFPVNKVFERESCTRFGQVLAQDNVEEDTAIIEAYAQSVGTPGVLRDVAAAIAHLRDPAFVADYRLVSWHQVKGTRGWPCTDPKTGTIRTRREEFLADSITFYWTYRTLGALKRANARTAQSTEVTFP